MAGLQACAGRRSNERVLCVGLACYLLSWNCGIAMPGRAIDRRRAASAEIFKEALMNLSWIHQHFKNGHFRSNGNGLPKPLDSSLRRNDGEAGIKAIRLPVCVYCFVVIPAKAGIQEGDDGMPHETLIQSELP